LSVGAFCPLKVVSNIDPDGTYILHIVYTCTAKTPAVVLSREHAEYSWFDQAELEALERSRYVVWALEALDSH